MASTIRPKSVAVVGSGIGGISAAYHLLLAGHKVTLFEKNNEIGGHAFTVEIDGEPVDLGFMMYGDSNPNIRAWFDTFSLPEGSRIPMSLAVRSDVAGDLQFSSRKPFLSLSDFFDRRQWRILVDIYRFTLDLLKMLKSPPTTKQTTAEWQAEGTYSTEFYRHYFLPFVAILWTIPLDAVNRLPVAQFLKCLAVHSQSLYIPLWQVVLGAFGFRTQGPSYRWYLMGAKYRAPFLSFFTGRGGQLRLGAKVVAVRCAEPCTSMSVSASANFSGSDAANGGCSGERGGSGSSEDEWEHVATGQSLSRVVASTGVGRANAAAAPASGTGGTPSLSKSVDRSMALEVEWVDVLGERGEDAPATASAVQRMRFDHVILAGHADCSADQIRDCWSAAAEQLQRFAAHRSTMLVHRDAEAFLPACRGQWASWNVLIAEDGTYVMTYWINRIQRLKSNKDIFVTIIPDGTKCRRPRSDTIVKEFYWSHPELLADSVPESDFFKLPGVSLAGAWLGRGFHEDGFLSGKRAAAAVDNPSIARTGLYEQPGTIPLPRPRSSAMPLSVRLGFGLLLLAPAAAVGFMFFGRR